MKCIPVLFSKLLIERVAGVPGSSDIGKKKILLLKGKGKEIPNVCPISSFYFVLFILLLPFSMLIRYMVVYECKLVLNDTYSPCCDNIAIELSS